jgi:hypothetical protein
LRYRPGSGSPWSRPSGRAPSCRNRDRGRVGCENAGRRPPRPPRAPALEIAGSDSIRRQVKRQTPGQWGRRKTGILGLAWSSGRLLLQGNRPGQVGGSRKEPRSTPVLLSEIFVAAAGQGQGLDPPGGQGEGDTRGDRQGRGRGCWRRGAHRSRGGCGKHRLRRRTGSSWPGSCAPAARWVSSRASGRWRGEPTWRFIYIDPTARRRWSRRCARCSGTRFPPIPSCNSRSWWAVVGWSAGFDTKSPRASTLRPALPFHFRGRRWQVRLAGSSPVRLRRAWRRFGSSTRRRSRRHSAGSVMR